MLCTHTEAWRALVQHQQHMASTSLESLFAGDSQRFRNFSLTLDDLLFDYSKQHVTTQTLKLLCDLAEESNLAAAIQSLFAGSIVNQTEHRAAWHTELRNPNPRNPDIKATIEQMTDFVTRMHNSDYTDVLVLGIGGSDLGPRLVCEALAPYNTGKLRLHFIANVDGDTITRLLQNLNPVKTICLINSKTFTTIETLSNANIIKEWFGISYAQHCWAITSNKEAAEAFGINVSNIFMFWDWVGGRYSVWSAVGLSIALCVGMDNFRRFLHGAHTMDQHFYSASFTENMPVLLALIGIWHINFLKYPTLCVQPYADGLQLLPAYLQQLEMESNGKSAANSGQFVDHQTVPVIWGGVGCNSQHAYMQMLHQGTQIVPVDFLVACRNHAGKKDLHKLLVASCLGQSQALMQGRKEVQHYKNCVGNRPSNTIMFDVLTPEVMGKLIALYEHKVFVQGVIWQVQSFDQWGVQVGKDLIKGMLNLMESNSVENIDSSTAGLLNYFLARSMAVNDA